DDQVITSVGGDPEDGFARAAHFEAPVCVDIAVLELREQRLHLVGELAVGEQRQRLGFERAMIKAVPHVEQIDLCTEALAEVRGPVHCRSRATREIDWNQNALYLHGVRNSYQETCQ